MTSQLCCVLFLWFNGLLATLLFVLFIPCASASPLWTVPVLDRTLCSALLDRLATDNTLPPFSMCNAYAASSILLVLAVCQS